MEHFFYEAGGQKFSYFFSNGLLAVESEAAESLFDGLCSLPDVQRVLDHLPGDTGHVRGFLGEDVPILLEEGDEL